MHVFTAETDPQEIERALDAGEPLWLDIPHSHFDLSGPAARAVGVDQDRMRRLRLRGERPGALVEKGQAMVMFAGVHRTPAGQLVRVDTMVFAADDVLVTVRDMPCDPLDELRAAVAAGSRKVDALLVLDQLTDSLLNHTQEIEDQVEGVENRILAGSAEDMLERLRTLRQSLTVILRIARSQNLLVATAGDELGDVPGIVGRPGRRVRDLGGHLALAADQAQSTREAIAEALDLSLQITSNRLGEAAERLSVIATLVLPATLVTGFFGMNFLWMTDRLDSFLSFLLLGIGGLIVSVIAARAYLRAKHID
jgi:Mg2+ and Co2+ transporter CorA